MLSLRIYSLLSYTEYVRVNNKQIFQLEIHPIGQNSRECLDQKKCWFKDRHLQEILLLIKEPLFEKASSHLEGTKNSSGSETKILTGTDHYGSTVRIAYFFKKKPTNPCLLTLAKEYEYRSSTDEEDYSKQTGGRYQSESLNKEKVVIYVCQIETGSRGMSQLTKSVSSISQNIDISSYFQRQTAVSSKPLSTFISEPSLQKQKLKKIVQRIGSKPYKWKNRNVEESTTVGKEKLAAGTSGFECLIRPVSSTTTISSCPQTCSDLNLVSSSEKDSDSSADLLVDLPGLSCKEPKAGTSSERDFMISDNLSFQLLQSGHWQERHAEKSTASSEDDLLLPSVSFVKQVKKRKVKFSSAVSNASSKTSETQDGLSLPQGFSNHHTNKRKIFHAATDLSGFKKKKCNNTDLQPEVSPVQHEKLKLCENIKTKPHPSNEKITTCAIGSPKMKNQYEKNTLKIHNFEPHLIVTPIFDREKMMDCSSIAASCSSLEETSKSPEEQIHKLKNDSLVPDSSVAGQTLNLASSSLPCTTSSSLLQLSKSDEEDDSSAHGIMQNKKGFVSSHGEVLDQRKSDTADSKDFHMEKKIACSPEKSEKCSRKSNPKKEGAVKINKSNKFRRLGEKKLKGNGSLQRTNSFSPPPQDFQVRQHLAKSYDSNITSDTKTACNPKGSQHSVNEKGDSEIIIIPDIDENINEVKDAKTVEELTERQLKDFVSKSESFLREIFEGRRFCHRHQEYKKSSVCRRNLDYRVYFGHLSEDQRDAIITTLLQIFCKHHRKYLDYVFRVMLPEIIVKLYMTIYRISQPEAEDQLSNIWYGP